MTFYRTSRFLIAAFFLSSLATQATAERINLDSSIPQYMTEVENSTPSTKFFCSLTTNPMRIEFCRETMAECNSRIQFYASQGWPAPPCKDLFKTRIGKIYCEKIGQDIDEQCATAGDINACAEIKSRSTHAKLNTSFFSNKREWTCK